MNVRLYNKSDLDTILSWYRDRKQFEPYSGMFLTDSTFVLEENQIPKLSVSVYLTNSKEIAFLEHLVCDPNFKGSERNEAINLITKYAENFTKDMGYKRLITMTHRESLRNKYLNFGYIENGQNLSLFVKDLV